MKTALALLLLLGSAANAKLYVRGMAITPAVDFTKIEFDSSGKEIPLAERLKKSKIVYSDQPVLVSALKYSSVGNVILMLEKKIVTAHSGKKISGSYEINNKNKESFFAYVYNTLPAGFKFHSSEITIIPFSPDEVMERVKLMIQSEKSYTLYLPMSANNHFLDNWNIAHQLIYSEGVSAKKYFFYPEDLDLEEGSFGLFLRNVFFRRF